MIGNEKLRDAFKTPPGPEYWRERMGAGWSLVAIEWERPGDSSRQDSAARQEVPYGLRVAGDCTHLEEDGVEMEAMTCMLEMIVADRSLSDVALDLNRRGLRTRRGLPWTQVSVFNLLPRLVEVAPGIFPTQDWAERRKKIYGAAGAG